MSKMTNTRMPDHLQKLIESKKPVDLHFQCDDSKCAAHKSYLEGAKDMYELIIQDLGPLVEAIENLQCNCHFNCNCGYDEAKKALKHLKERILK